MDTVLPSCPHHGIDYDRECDFCGDLKQGWARLAANEELDRAWAEKQALDLKQAVEDGTALAEAQEMFPLVAARTVADRKIELDAIPGVLGPRGTVTEITGYRGAGKSLGTFGIAAAVGCHQPTWQGLPVRDHGPVIYIAREGQAGWTRRVQAWEAYHHHRIEPGEVDFIERSLDVTRPHDLAALATMVRHHRAQAVVLDPTALTGGGDESYEQYSLLRRSAIELAADEKWKTRVILLTNSGHKDRTRGRNAAVLVDGADVSLAFVKQNEGQLNEVIEVLTNKHRDTEPLVLSLRFEGVGKIDPSTGKPLSGVLVKVGTDDRVHMEMQAVDDLWEKALAALREAGCTCPEETYDPPCGHGIKPADFYAALGLHGEYASEKLKKGVRPLTRYDKIRTFGQTQGLRWHVGHAEQPKTSPA